MMLRNLKKFGCSLASRVNKPFVAITQPQRQSHTVEEASFEVAPCKLHLLDNGPSTRVNLTRKEALNYYKDLISIRRLESAAASLYKEKAIRGFCHLSSGQEAVAVGIKAALRSQDTVITSYRCHGFALLMGLNFHSILAELTGRVTGCVRGKGGSMHMYAPNFYGGNGIVGAQVPLGAGLAFAHKYKKDGGVSFALYGDGAANQGQVYETYNIAKLWNIPVILVCENNHYGMGTPQERASASTTFFTRGDYIPGIQVDGMDILAVREAANFAVEHCTSDKGPLVCEMVTYRYHGHSMSDPGTSYRTRDEVQEMRQNKDPITGFREKIVAAGLTHLDELKEMEQEIKKLIDVDMKKAKTDPEIDLKDISNDIYEHNLQGAIRGRSPFEMLEHKKTQKALNV